MSQDTQWPIDRPPTLDNSDHRHMDDFLACVLDDYKNGEIDRDRAVGGLAHVMAALERGNHDEARKWFEQGRKFIRVAR